MIHSEQLNELAKALCLSQSQFGAIPKDSYNPFFKSQYADLPDAKKIADPIINANGLVVTQTLGENSDGDTLTTMLLHESGQYIMDTMHLHLVKNDPQSHGSSTTYARRYSYMAILGLVADLDDDANRGSQQQSKPAESQPRPAAKPAPKPQPPAREVDAQPGEIVDNGLQKLLATLDEAGQQTIKNKMRESNYPPIEKLPKAAQKTVLGWVAQEQDRSRAEEVF